MPKPRFSKPARSKAGSFSGFFFLPPLPLNTGTAVVGTGLAAAAGVGFAEDRAGLRGAAADAARGHRAGAPPAGAAVFAALGFAAGFAARCAGSRGSRGAAASSDVPRPPNLASTGDVPNAAGRAGGAATFEGAAAAGVFAGAGAVGASAGDTFAGAAGAGALPGESIGGAAGRAGTAGAASRARAGAAAGEAGRAGVGAIADGTGAAAGAGPFAAAAARLARRDARFDAGAAPVSEGRGS